MAKQSSHKLDFGGERKMMPRLRGTSSEPLVHQEWKQSQENHSIAGNGAVWGCDFAVSGCFSQTIGTRGCLHQLELLCISFKAHPVGSWRTGKTLLNHNSNG